MPRLIRIAGMLSAFAWTLLAAVAATALLMALLPVWFWPVVADGITALLGLSAVLLLLLVSSYAFAALVHVTGTGQPVTLVTETFAAIYLMVTTAIAAVGAILLVLFLPALLLIALLFLPCWLAHLAQVTIAHGEVSRFSRPVRGFIRTPEPYIENRRECWFRGNLIGMNGAANAVLAMGIYLPLFLHLATTAASSSSSATIIVGINATGISAAAAAVMLAVVVVMPMVGVSLLSATVAPALPSAPTLHDWVKGTTYWLSWLMPMSWPLCLRGWLEFYVAWVLHLYARAAQLVVVSMFGSGSPEATTAATYTTRFIITDMRLDYGMISFGGGWTFDPFLHNYGCFTFNPVIRATNVWWVIENQAGHHLNLAAFGWMFRLVESEFWRTPYTYGYYVAASNVRPPNAKEITIWS